MALKYKHTILFVDDEVSITNSLKRVFRKEGYNILTASSGEEGLEVIKSAERPVSLVVSDQRMPGMNGAEFLSHVKTIVPKAIRFLLTGYSDMEAVIDAVNEGEIHRYITKPWNNDDLLLQVRSSLEQYELLIENNRLLALTAKQNKELGELNKDLEQRVEDRTKEIVAKGEELSLLNEKLESSLYNSVSAFASIADIYIPSLAGHGRRVSELASEIVHRLEDFSEREIKCIEIAALLHDIGKMGFPPKLVNYRDYDENQWSPQDKEKFRTHPEAGQTIFRLIDHLDHIGLLIRSHHERYDGDGYPDKLKEEEIPLGARIITVADAYDRIVNLESKSYLTEYSRDNNVPYDSVSGEDQLQQAAIYYLKKYAFTMYDPDIVKIFLDILKEQGVGSHRGKNIKFHELKPGMTLAAPLYSSDGLFLFAKGRVVSKEDIEKLNIVHRSVSIKDYIAILDK